MKDEIAEKLALAHYQNDPSLKLVRWLVAPPQVEANPEEPIKLLEVNEAATADGIIPVRFDPRPSSGIIYPTVIVEITPAEYEEIVRDPSILPNEWSLGDLIEREAAAH